MENELDDLIKRLRDSKAQTLAYFELSEPELDYSYGEDKWTIRQILHHIADAETVLYERIRRTIVNPGQTLNGFEQDLWAEVLDYNHFPLAVNKKIYDAVRDASIMLISKFYITYGSNTFVHSKAGEKTLTELCQKNAWHNEKHLEHILLALSLNKKTE